MKNPRRTRRWWYYVFPADCLITVMEYIKINDRRRLQTHECDGPDDTTIAFQFVMNVPQGSRRFRTKKKADSYCRHIHGIKRGQKRNAVILKQSPGWERALVTYRCHVIRKLKQAG